MPSTASAYHHYNSPPSPNELYDPNQMHHQPTVLPPQTVPPSMSAPSASMQSAVPNQPVNAQLVPSMQSAQHLEHYSPYYTSAFNHSGGQCYTRSIQPPFIGKQMYGKPNHIHYYLPSLYFVCFVNCVLVVISSLFCVLDASSVHHSFHDSSLSTRAKRALTDIFFRLISLRFSCFK